MLRDQAPVEDRVFVVMPFGTKHLGDGQLFDFDTFYRKAIKPTIEDGCGLIAQRADDIYGPSRVMDVVWQGLQEAEIVLVDFSARAPNVALEFGMALLLNKRVVVLAQSLDDVPSDVKDHMVITYTSEFTDVQSMQERLASQLYAKREMSVTEMAIVPFGGTLPVARHTPAKVIDVRERFVVVETEAGHHGVLRNDDVTYTRIIPDMRISFHEGDRIEDGAFILDPEGGTKYTLLAGQPNPWPLLANSHPKGTRFNGEVHSVKTSGVFVRVAHGLNGLVPARTLTSTEGLGVGSKVNVQIREIDGENRRIALDWADLGPHDIGARMTGKIVRTDANRVFLLVALPSMRKTAILPASGMSASLESKVRNSEVNEGYEIYVEIIRIDREHLRVELKELPEQYDLEEASG